jgi:hypothetical protein
MDPNHPVDPVETSTLIPVVQSRARRALGTDVAVTVHASHFRSPDSRLYEPIKSGTG